MVERQLGNNKVGVVALKPHAREGLPAQQQQL